MRHYHRLAKARTGGHGETCGPGGEAKLSLIDNIKLSHDDQLWQAVLIEVLNDIMIR